MLEWIIGVLFGVACALIGVIYWSLQAQIKEQKKDLLHDIAQLRASNDSLTKFFQEWRHDKYSPFVTQTQLDILKVQEKVAQLEKWKNGSH